MQDVLPDRLGVIEAEEQTALILEDLGDIAYRTPAVPSSVGRRAASSRRCRLPPGSTRQPPGTTTGGPSSAPSTNTMLADVPLWDAILADAAERFPDIVTTEVVAARRETLDTVSRWHPARTSCRHVWSRTTSTSATWAFVRLARPWFSIGSLRGSTHPARRRGATDLHL